MTKMILEYYFDAKLLAIEIDDLFKFEIVNQESNWHVVRLFAQKQNRQLKIFLNVLPLVQCLLVLFRGRLTLL